MRISTQIQQFVEKSANITTLPEAVCTAVITAFCKNGSFRRITHCIFSTGIQRSFLNSTPLRTTRLPATTEYPARLKYNVHQQPKTAAAITKSNIIRGKITAPATSGSNPAISIEVYAAPLFSISSPTFHNRVSIMVA